MAEATTTGTATTGAAATTETEGTQSGDAMTQQTNTAATVEANDPAAMADALRKANAEAKKYRLEAKAHSEALEQLRQQSMTDQDKAIAEARAAGVAEAEERWRNRLLDSDLQLIAGPLSSDPKLVAKLVDRTAITWTDGDYDRDSAQAEVQRVVAEYPALAPATEQKSVVPTVAAGARGGSEQPDPGSMSMEQFREWRKANA